MITKEQAIAIAIKHCAGVLRLSETSVLHLEETPSHIIVEWRTEKNDSLCQADFEARVMINRQTGEITESFVGS